MNIHLCEENPCPIQDKETLERLKNGFTTTYTEDPRYMPVGNNPPYEDNAW